MAIPLRLQAVNREPEYVNRYYWVGTSLLRQSPARLSIKELALLLMNVKPVPFKSPSKQGNQGNIMLIMFAVWPLFGGVVNFKNIVLNFVRRFSNIRNKQ